MRKCRKKNNKEQQFKLKNTTKNYKIIITFRKKK